MSGVSKARGATDLDELYLQAEKLEQELIKSMTRERKLRKRYDHVVETAERLESMMIERGPRSGELKGMVKAST